jgi:hypothetical protein
MPLCAYVRCFALRKEYEAGRCHSSICFVELRAWKQRAT